VNELCLSSYLEKHGEPPFVSPKNGYSLSLFNVLFRFRHCDNARGQHCTCTPLSCAVISTRQGFLSKTYTDTSPLVQTTTTTTQSAARCLLNIPCVYLEASRVLAFPKLVLFQKARTSHALSAELALLAIVQLDDLSLCVAEAQRERDEVFFPLMKSLRVKRLAFANQKVKRAQTPLARPLYRSIPPKACLFIDKNAVQALAERKTDGIYAAHRRALLLRGERIIVKKPEVVVHISVYERHSRRGSGRNLVQVSQLCCAPQM
jgi:hypothetical protein